MATEKETAMTNTLKPTLTLDVELYQHYLDGSDLTNAEKAELLETFWSIICEFVRLGFGVHPVQQAQNAGGKHAENNGETGFLSIDMLRSIASEMVNTAPEK
jgi:hypothetical protein